MNYAAAKKCLDYLSTDMPLGALEALNLALEHNEIDTAKDFAQRALHMLNSCLQAVAEAMEASEDSEDICGLCGLPGADKPPRPIHWPGERESETDLVHAECEEVECRRAHAALSEKQREEFLRHV